MRTKDELFRDALRRIATRRQRAVMQADDARRAAYAADPALAAADDAQMRAGLALAKTAALGGDVPAAQAALAAAEQAVADCAKAAGYKPEDFTPRYTCPDCQDTGTRGGVPCHCVAETARKLRREEINSASPLGLCKFSSFDLTRYAGQTDPELTMTVQEFMGKLLRYCQKYAEGFTPKSINLMFTGGSGRGKTHMALAIADTVLDAGYDVLYTSAAALVAHLGREHFDRDSSNEWLTACQDADLLILDDLGTEYITPLTISILYELINARMLLGRPTVYTTNITDPSVLTSRYTDKVASRIQGNCKVLKFFGPDQRKKTQK